MSAGRLAVRGAAVCTVLMATAAFAGAADRVSVEVRGTVAEALREVAEEAELSLVLTAPLDEPAEVVLRDVPAEEALRTIARAHGLSLRQDGAVWVVERAGAKPAAPVPAPPPPSREVGPAEDVVHFGNGTRVEPGASAKSAVAFGGPLEVGVGARVEEDAVSFGGDVILRPGSVVNGDAVAFGGRVHREDGAVVKGDEVSFGVGGNRLSARAETPERVSWLARFFLRFCLFFGLGFLFSMFIPARMRRVETELRQRPVQSMLTGIGASVGGGLLLALLTVSIIGIPLALLLGVLGGLAGLLGLTSAASALGMSVPMFRARKSQAVVLALGLLLFLLAAEVPVLGGLVYALTVLAGLGAVVRTRLGRDRSMPQLDRTPVGST